jgi:hypothetical protein
MHRKYIFLLGTMIGKQRKLEFLFVLIDGSIDFLFVEKLLTSCEMFRIFVQTVSAFPQRKSSNHKERKIQQKEINQSF